MNRRLIKELRPLVLPALIGVVAALAPLFWSPLGSGGGDEALHFFSGLGILAFVCTIALVSCMPFGVELQERTFPLLLSQPIERNRIWIEKVAVSVAVVAGLVWVQAWANQRSQWSGQLSAHDEFELVMFLVLTVSSGGFWTLVARSTLGGIAFALASQVLLISWLGYLLERINNGPIDWNTYWKTLTPAMQVAGVMYAIALLWLGRRKLANLELRGHSMVGLPGRRGSSHRIQLPGWLRCQASGHISNLVRKELRLQQPVFLVAGLVLVCWLATLGLCSLATAQKHFFEGIGNVLTGACMVLVPLLAGCISLGEEKTLGLHSWQLTLPASAWRQWSIKLAIAAGVGIGLGLIMPYLLAWLSSPLMETGLAQALPNRREALLISLAMVGVAFVLSFWASTLLASTVKAALMGIAGLVVLFSAVVWGAWYASENGGMEAPLLKWVIADFHLAGEASGRSLLQAGTFVGYLCAASALVLLLGQSLAQFRRALVETWTIVSYAIVIAAFTFSGAFWVVDIQMSDFKARRQLQTDLSNALQSLPDVRFERGRDSAISIEDLEKTGQLSEAAKTWLKGARITARPVEENTLRSHPERILGPPMGGLLGPPTGRVSNDPRVAVVHFPNGQQEFVLF